MKILTIGNAKSPHILGRAKAFQKAGCKNKIISELPVIDAEIEIISPFKNLASQNGWNRCYSFLLNVVRLLKIIYNEDYDIIHIHYAYHYLAFIASILSKKPIIAIIMGGDVLFEQHSHVNWYQRLLIKYTLGNADLIISKSPYIEKRIKILCNGQCRVITCLFGIEPFFLVQDLFRKENFSFKFISVRSVKPFYNIDKIIDVIFYLNKENISPILNIICFSVDRDYLELLRQKVMELGITNCVNFLSPVHSPKELIFLYKDSNFIIALPESDGIPQSSLEGMAQGCVNILPNNVVYDGVFTEENSILVQGAAKDIAQQILVKLASDELIKIQSNARRLVEEYGSLDKNINKMILECQKVIKKRMPIKFHTKLKMFLLILIYFVDQFFIFGIRNRFNIK